MRRRVRILLRDANEAGKSQEEAVAPFVLTPSEISQGRLSPEGEYARASSSTQGGDKIKAPPAIFGQRLPQCGGVASLVATVRPRIYDDAESR